MRLTKYLTNSLFLPLRPILLLTVFLALGTQHGLTRAEVVDLTVGSYQICLLDDEHNLRCKTRAFTDRLLPPAEMPELVSIAAGNAHLCGITTSGSVFCFGDNDFGQTSHESVTLDYQYSDISAGGNFSCATRVSELRIDCWGDVSEQLPSTLDDFLRSEGSSLVENINFTVLGSRNICWAASINSNSLTSVNPRDSLQCWEIGRGFYHVLDVVGGQMTSASNDDRLHCTISGNGQTTCLEDIGWQREFRSTSFNQSGPYSQVAVSGGVVCVLTTGGQLDCDTSLYEGDAPGREERRIAASINARVDELANTRFTHLEPHHVYFNNGGRAFCLTDTQNELHCLGNGVFDAVSISTQNPDWIDTGTLNSDSNAPLLAINNIAVYSHGIVELFWNPTVDFNNYSHVEIYRDGILLTTTTNADSYFDNTLQGSTTYSYRIREVGIDGTAGEMSDEFTVSTPRDYTIIDWGSADTPLNCDGGILPAPVALEVRTYGRTIGELFWQKNAYPSGINVAFNIFINGTLINSEPLENNGSFYLYGDDLFISPYYSGSELTNSPYRYTLNAVDGCGRVSEMSNEVSP